MKAKSIFIRFAALFALCASAAFAAPAPRLACDEPVFDFGDVSSDAQSTVDHDYLIRNDGDLSLEILSVRASCGCTAVNASQSVVAPGATATIHASFNLANRSGAQVKTITVTSNDPERPTTLLTLRGNIVKPLSANPAAVYYGRISSPASASREIVLTASQPFTVTSATTVSPHLAAAVDTPSAATTHTLTLSVLPSMPSGPFGDTLTVLTDLPVGPKILIPLTGFWTPAPEDPDPQSP
jgi:hypothetical protein